MAERGGNRSSPHSAVLRLCEDYLRARGAWTLRVAGGLGTRAGAPDLLFCIRAQGALRAVFGAVEVKTGRGALSVRQQGERAAIEAAGGLWILAHDVDDVETALLDAGLIRDRALRPVGSRR